MEAWFHCENPYPFVPDKVLEEVDSVRASLPNRYCDPQTAALLFEETLDEYRLCDELGLNITSSEHHAGINALYGASPLVLGIVARETKNIRLLSMGTLITVRNDPVRAAEEYATADVISRGRLEIGFVKSGGTEMASGNANPIGIRERFWEAIDLIGKSLSHHEGPFSWEGKHFTHRHVNIWPPPYQQPLPPMWAATSDPIDTAELGRRGMVNIMVMRGVDVTKRAWGAYKQARAEAGLPKAKTDRFGYSAFVYVGDTDDEAVKVGSKLLWFVNTSMKSAPQYQKFLPGTTPPELAPALYRDPNAAGSLGRPGRDSALNKVGVTAEMAMAGGRMYAGNPDTVYRQIMEFYEKVGGFGQLIMVGKTGFITHDEAVKNITMFSKEVLPRLREIKPVEVE
jgi:alkanesulfonate monooxygenase SsuD/methylene tetrahydromethanopterin reductase-like flavin-dependent oxidoreductase (luciferase family)